MKFSLRLAASTLVTLSAGAVAFGQHYTQTNLVSNAAGIAPVTDPQLINPWGVSRGSGTAWWVSDNLTGVSTLYNGAGTKNPLVVTIPPADPTNKKTPTGSPTGTVFNGSASDFLLAPKTPAAFLFWRCRTSCIDHGPYIRPRLRFAPACLRFCRTPNQNLPR